MPYLTLRRLLSILAALPLLGSALQAEPAEDEEPQPGTVIRILSPASRLVEGRVEIETLSISPDIHKVVFYVDGAEAAKRNRVPFNAKLTLASPPREQKIEVMAYGRRDRLIGHDALAQRPAPPRTAGG